VQFWKEAKRVAGDPLDVSLIKCIVIGTATRDTRAQRPTITYGAEGENWKLFARTHRYSFRMGQDLRRFTNGFDEAP